jgi:hypothetical protein
VSIIKNVSRLGALLAALGVITAAFAGAASASTAMVPRPDPGGTIGTAPSPSVVVRTVVVGGMPGWQIALIVVVAALAAAVAAVLADRSYRRRPVTGPA